MARFEQRAQYCGWAHKRQQRLLVGHEAEHLFALALALLTALLTHHVRQHLTQHRARIVGREATD
eukprot:7383492-Prymnesium_polylepis.2